MTKFKLDQVRTGAVVSYFAIGVNIITGLLYTPWMVRQIGQSNYGLYTLATSLIAIFMLDFGLGSAVSRFVSKYRAEGNQEGINSIVGVIYKLYIAIDNWNDIFEWNVFEIIDEQKIEENITNDIKDLLTPATDTHQRCKGL